MEPIELLRDTLAPVRHRRAVAADRAEDRALATLSRGFQRRGGLATADEVVRLMRPRCDQPISRLARWIVDRNLVHFAWQGATLLPLFQFDRDRMRLDPIVIGVVRELRDTFDDWEIALWFVTPNASMNGVMPVDAFESTPLTTLAAAQAERLVASGLGKKRDDSE
jgi:hypothetical protein